VPNVEVRGAPPNKADTNESTFVVGMVPTIALVVLLSLYSNPQRSIRKRNCIKTGATYCNSKKITATMAASETNDEWQDVPRQRRQRCPPQWTSSPVMVEYIPPTPVTTYFEPFMILLVGLPGSGKSTFANLLAQAMPYKFDRVNQDELKTRKQCIKFAKQALDQRKCVIIDRCNFDESQRQTWYDLAKSNNVAVHGIILHVPIKLCIQRCQKRQGHETIKGEDAKKVVDIVNNKLKLPSHAEESSFSSLLTLSNSDSFNDAVVQHLNK
jgi:predicted kinase